MVCGYVMAFIPRNLFLRCAFWSSVCGCVGTLLVALYNGIERRDKMTDAVFFPLMLAIELVWRLSEVLAGVTTWCKIKMMFGAQRERNNIIFAAFVGIFFLARLPISIIRLHDRTIWDTRVFRAHTAYYFSVVLADSLLTFVLINDTRQLSRDTQDLGSVGVRSFIHYSLLGSLFRVVYMNVIILILAVTFIPSESVSANSASLNTTLGLSLRSTFF